MAQLIEVRVPEMGNFKDVPIIDLLVKPGDTIEVETPLVTLETEKATMDVPSTAAGIIEQLHVQKGGRVSTGDLVATVRPAEGAGAEEKPAPAKEEVKSAQSAPAKAPTPPPAPAVSETPAAPPQETAPVEAAPRPASAAKAAAPATTTALEPGVSRVHAGPAVRRFAREMGVNLAGVKGSGFKGRVTAEDVKAFVKQALSARTESAQAGARGSALPTIPEMDFAQFGPVDIKPLSRIQRISGPRLHASWINLPHVTQFDEADITELEELRTSLKQKALQQGIKLTPLAFILRACVKALQEFPQFNTSLDASAQNLIWKQYFHIGFAADTPNGLVVPVIHDANRKDIYEIARLLGELSEKARAGRLSVADMQGGTFTISSLGGIGGTAFTPIINAPEVAILGVSRSSVRPVFKDGGFVPRLMLPLSLSYDHRVIDGANAAHFTTFLAQTLADPRGLLEAVL